MGSRLFLPIDSVLKEESNPPTASSPPAHSYNTRSKDKHDVHNVDPEDTLQLLQQLSQKESRSEMQFTSEHHEVAKRQDNKNRPLGRDYIGEQKRLYEEAQRASRQKQQSHLKGNTSNAHQYEERLDQQKVQGSNVDSVSYLGTGQQQFYGGYQPPSYHHQNVSHYQSQLSSQLPYPQPDPAAQMQHIPRAGIEENFTHNPANYSSNIKDHGPYQQMQHQYERVPSLDQPVSYSQLQQQPNLGSNQINPNNLVVGSMILHGYSPARTGIIKWMGYLPESNTLSAGIEMVSKIHT